LRIALPYAKYCADYRRKALFAQFGTLEEFWCGYNAKKDDYIDMINIWLIDTVKVVGTTLVDMSRVLNLLDTREWILLRWTQCGRLII
jgi:hypothetical protein